MDLLEFLFGLIELLEPIEALCELAVWLFRVPFRLARWMRNPSDERGGQYLRDDSRVRRPTENRSMTHLSLTRRSRGKWRGASYVLR
jgi:hypothetical protein